MNERKIGIETEKHFLKNTRYIFIFFSRARDEERQRKKILDF